MNISVSTLQLLILQVMSWLLGSSTEPWGHLWSESKEAAVAVSIPRDAFGSPGVRLVVPKPLSAEGQELRG